MDPQLARIISTHGVFLRREAKDLGYHDTTIDRLVADGTFHRVRWGSFTYVELWEPLSVRERYALTCRAAVRRSNTQVFLSHVSALNLWESPTWDLDLSHVHLTRLDGRAGRKATGIAQHRGAVVDGDVVEHGGLLLASPTRAALELTTMADVEHSLVEIDQLLHRGLTTVARLRSRYELMNHWPDTLRTDLVLRLVDGRSESVGETRVRYFCWARSLPAPIPNYEIRDQTGRVLYRVDFAWPELGLFAEFDGKEKYVRHRREGETVVDCVLREKRREEAIRAMTGWACVRITWADLYRPEELEARITPLFRPRSTLAPAVNG